MARPRYVRSEEQWVDDDGVWPRRTRLAEQRRDVLPQEKRQFERIPVSRQARLIELDSFDAPGQPFPCTVLNVSRGGIGLCVIRMIHLERRVFVEVMGNPGDRPRLFFGTVKQVRYVEGQGHIVGIQFEPIPSSTPVAKWLSRRKRRPQA
jgi:hypothetical protein